MDKRQQENNIKLAQNIISDIEKKLRNIKDYIAKENKNLLAKAGNPFIKDGAKALRELEAFRDEVFQAKNIINDGIN